MASSALSEEEFHRLQLQLLELRTTNYELEGKCKKLERDLQIGQEKCDSLDKELAKANKIINKSKKTKEVELLLQENDGLQRKLHSQEEEFRLQNQTLMQELSSLVAANEQLEKNLGNYEDVNTAGKGGNSDLEDEIRRLQAQNAALQKNYASTKEKYEKELNSLRSGSEGPPSTERESPTGVKERRLEGSEEELDKVITDGDGIGNLYEEIQKLKISLDTELEEKKIIKEELLNQEKKLQDQIKLLEEEAEKLNEKLKRKQESFMALQKEKEDMFNESSKKIEELQSGRERDKKYYQDLNIKLQAEIEKLKQMGESEKSAAEQKIQSMEQSMAKLQTQVNAACIVGNQQLQEQSNKYQAESTDLRNKITKLMQEKDDLHIQLTECQKAAAETMEQFNAAQQDRDLQIQSLQEISKVAEKRKSILDEMAIKYQKEIDNHRETVNNMEAKHETEIKILQEEITNLQEKVLELEKQKVLFEELQQTHKSVSESKSWLERRLTETEESFEETKQQHEESMMDIKSSHEAVISKLTEEHKSEVAKLLEEQQGWRTEWEEKENKLLQEIETLKSSITSLQQEIKDGVGDKKIHEKKGLTMIKDLKRQLHSERKRAEKLQEKLQEILTDSKDRQSMEDLFRPNDNCDNSSVSSWSAGASSHCHKDTTASGPQSPSHTNNSFSSEVEQEYGDLLARVGGMQQKSWALEEKVAHLEMSNACMAEDLLRKTAIIEHYVMESRPDHRSNNNQHEDKPGKDKLSLKKVLDLVNKTEDNELKEMNRKLQNMVEETLTKNMHLQKDLEMMSNEIVRLSKLQQSEENVANGSTAQENTKS